MDGQDDGLNETRRGHILFRNIEAYAWSQVAQYIPSTAPSSYPTPRSPGLTEPDNGCHYRLGKEVILENESDSEGNFLKRLPLSDVGARPPWRIDPFLGTWPNNRRRRRAEAEAAERARLAEHELLVSKYREQEERARGFGDDDEFLDDDQFLTQGTTTSAAQGAQTEPSSSLLPPPDASQSSMSWAVPIRHPGEGIPVTLPRQASSSTGRLSKAIPIVRPDDGTIVIPPPLRRVARPGSTASRASLGQAERERETTGVVEPALQPEAKVTTSTRTSESQGSPDVSEEGNRTPKASGASIISADGDTGSSDFVYVESRGSRV